MLRGRDRAAIQQLFRDNLHEIYDRLFDIDADALEVPEDYSSSIAAATATSRDNQNVELEPQLLLYKMEFYKIVKIGGINNPFACVEWPGIQIPQAILNLLGTKGIIFYFLDDKGAWEESPILFYERIRQRGDLTSTTTPRTNQTSRGTR
jgi:hypothetical protein